jgi:hypothetical protein
MDLNDIEWKVVDFIHVTQDHELSFSIKVGELLDKIGSMEL